MLRRVAAGMVLILTISAGVVQARASTSTTPPDSTVPSAPDDTSEPPASSSPAPSTSLDPVAAEEQQVAATAAEAHAAALRLFAAPDDPAAAAALDELYVAGAPARATVETEAQRLAEAGTRVRENADSPGSFTVEQVTLGGGPPATSADLTVCVVLSWVEYTPATGSSVPETSEQIVAETLTARRATYHMAKGDDARWRIATTAVLATYEGQTSCPVDPVAAEQALIAQRVQEINTVGWSAYFNPEAPGANEALDSIYTENGETMQVVQSDLQALRDEGWVVRPNPDVPQSITVENVTVLDGPQATLADVITCVIDSTILVNPGALPDGGDMIVNDEVLAFRSVHHMRVEDGTWQLEDVETVAEWRGVATCPAA